MTRQPDLTRAMHDDANALAQAIDEVILQRFGEDLPNLVVMVAMGRMLGARMMLDEVLSTYSFAELCDVLRSILDRIGSEAERAFEHLDTGTALN